MPVYKAYAWDGSTYTEISNEWKGGAVVPVLAINPDQTPVYQGLSFSTIEDYKTGILAVGKYVAVEKDGSMIWYGRVASNRYNVNTKMNEYNIDSYFEKLKTDTVVELSFYLQLNASAPDCIEINTSLPAGHLDGNGMWIANTLTYFEITVKGFIKAMIEGSGFLNMTAVFDLDTNIDAVISAFKINHKNLETWKSKYSDYESETNLYNMLDILSIILKIFGLRMFVSDTETITVKGSDTAPDIESFDDNYVFEYDRSTKSAEKFKRVFLKQKEYLIRDDIDPENPDYYFSVGVLFSYNRVLDMINSGSDLELTFALAHKIPAANNSMFTKLKMIGYSEGTIDQSEGEWSVSDTDKIKLIGRQLTDMRCSQTNVGDYVNIVSTTIYAVAGATTVISHLTFADAYTSTANIIIYGCYNNDMKVYVEGNYTYEAGTGDPSDGGKFRIQADGKIRIRHFALPAYTRTLTYANEGIVHENLGTTGTPKYIQYARRTTQSGMPVIAIHYSSAGHGVVNTDKYSVFGTSGLNGDYTYNNTLPDATKYHIFSSTVIHILDEGQDIESYCDLRVWNEEYELSKQLTTEGRDDSDVRLYDYLTIYRPNYSTAGDWKDDWKTVSLQDTVNTLLLNATLYSPWWFYFFSPYYQTIYSESISVEDTQTADLTKARNVQIDIGNKSISIDQDEP